MKSEITNKDFFNFDAIEVILSNKSVIDSESFLTEFKSAEDVEAFLKGYGININNPIEYAEMFGHFQEAMQIIRRKFLKEGNSEGLDFSIPSTIASLTNVVDLFLLSGSKEEQSSEIGIWAGIILKVMHTLIHIDKDLRQNYFKIIQTQIFDRFYKYLDRRDDKLFLKGRLGEIEIIDFETKAKKTRESVVIKLLHKRENVAEELFDRIGIRLIAKSKIDCMLIVKFLYEHHVITPHNIKPSRSHNSLFTLDEFVTVYKDQVDRYKENFNFNSFKKIIQNLSSDELANRDNVYSSKKYQAIHFTCRQLIRYTNPFYNELENLKKSIKDKEILDKLENLNMSSIAKDTKFFYPYEIQITDQESHLRNSEGESSHDEYKNLQLRSAIKRLFRPLLEN